jgi:hypothetical protein
MKIQGKDTRAATKKEEAETDSSGRKTQVAQRARTRAINLPSQMSIDNSHASANTFTHRDVQAAARAVAIRVIPSLPWISDARTSVGFRCCLPAADTGGTKHY